VSCIPQNEMVVFAGYMNGHVRSTVITLPMIGHMVALGMELGMQINPGYWES